MILHTNFKIHPGHQNMIIRIFLDFFVSATFLISGVCVHIVPSSWVRRPFAVCVVTYYILTPQEAGVTRTHTPVFTVASCPSGRFAFRLRAETVGLEGGPVSLL